MPVEGIAVLPSTDLTAVPVATDRVGDHDYQVVKLDMGGDGVAVPLADTDAGRLPVGGSAIGGLTEAAPANDTASSGLNGRLQRIAQNLTSLIAPLGALTEAAPASDTASSGLNGRLQRIAQRLTSLIALVPASLGQKTMANSFAVTVASDQSVVPMGVAYSTLTQTVAVGQTLAGTGVDTNGYELIGILVPSNFDGTVIQFQVSNDNVAYYTLYDPNDTIMTITTAANRAVAVWAEVRGWRYYKISCGTSQAGTDTIFAYQLASGRS